MNWRKLTAAGIMLLLMVSYGLNIFAADQLPGEFWSLNEAYLNAKEAGNDTALIAYGEQVIELLTSRPETQQAKEVLASRYYDVADAYDRQGNFETAAMYYKKYIPYGKYMHWDDGVKIAEFKVAQYPSTVQGFTDAVQPQRYFGMRNEPESGVLYGEVSEQTRQSESMILLYIDYGNMLSDWDYSIFEAARQRGAAVEIAWNIQGEGEAVKEIPNQKEYITAFLEELNRYPDVPIFLRIGAEMNIWDIQADPEEFKTAFRIIADLVHEKTEHVATVWSVSHASAWGIEMEDFYPGDEYVDWVGISAYMIRYFQGQEWPVEERYSEVSFGSGDAADPLMVIRETVEKFGDRKPIMLAECGSAHTTISLSREHSDWAVNHLRRMYWFVPMVYPQVKLMAYFNTYVPPETNDYALTHCQALEEAYQELIQAPHFIQERFDGKPKHGYQPLQDAMVLAQTTVPVYAYPHVFGDDAPLVRYYIDGNLVFETADIPYRAELDFTQYSLGKHELRIETISNGNVAATAHYQIQVAEDIHITVDGKELQSDVVPVMENDRVLVPMRTIFEALGAKVEWDEETQTVTAEKGWTEIQITLNESKMRKNEKEYELDTTACMINDRTMVPVRAVSEAFDAKVEWSESEKTVTIQQKQPNPLYAGIQHLVGWISEFIS